MIHNLSFRWLFCLATTLLVLSSAWVPAQDDPFSTVSKKDDAKEKTKAGEDVPLALQRKRVHPVIASLQDHPPKTIPEVMRALKLTLEIDHPEQFKAYAAQFVVLKPNDAQLVAFHEQYGGALFWQMARRREFAPEGREIGEMVIEAAANHAQDLKLLSAEIPKLYVETSRKLATLRLAQGGTAGVNAILKACAAANSPEQHEQLRNALVAMKKDAIGPCIAALQAKSPEVRVDATLVLGRLKSTEAILYLVGPAVGIADEAGIQAAREALLMRTKNLPDAVMVQAFLEKQMNNYLAGQIPAEPDADDLIPMWQWNEGEQMAELKRFERTDASLLVADRIAKQLTRLVPKSPETRKRTMLVRLETERNLNGLDNPLVADENSAYALATNAGVEVVESILQDALQQRMYGAAVSAAEILGASGQSELLNRGAGLHSPLIDAMNSADQRTQFAALQAVLALAKQSDFAGSSRVVATANYLLSGQGTPRILVAHPRVEEANRIASMFTELGYTAESAGNGQDLVRQAKANADIEVILASDTLNRPSVLESTQMLRHDARTASIPLGIMIHEHVQNKTYWDDVNVIHTSKLLGGLNAANAWTPPSVVYARGADAAKQADNIAEVISPPHSLETARWQLQMLLKLGGRRIVPGEVRAERASQVLDGVLKLVSAEQPAKYHDFSRMEASLKMACDNTLLVQRAMQALGHIGTPNAQLFLAERASLAGLAEDQRQAAIAALNVAVKKRGLYLTQARLEHQYKLYNASLQSHVDNSAILGALLDVVESPRKQRESLE